MLSITSTSTVSLSTSTALQNRYKSKPATKILEEPESVCVTSPLDSIRELLNREKWVGSKDRVQESGKWRYIPSPRLVRRAKISFCEFIGHYQSSLIVRLGRMAFDHHLMDASA
jgi:hypothetical protein